MGTTRFVSGSCFIGLIGILLAVKIEHSNTFFKTTFGKVFLPSSAKQNSVAYTNTGSVPRLWCAGICSRNGDCHYFYWSDDNCVVIGYHWLEGGVSNLVLQASDVIYAKESNIPGINWI